MGDLQPLRFQQLHRAGNESEARCGGKFISRFEQNLHAQADAQQRFFLACCLIVSISPLCRSIFIASGKRPLRQDQSVGRNKVFGAAGDLIFLSSGS
jgi:hypothetical protein